MKGSLAVQGWMTAILLALPVAGFETLVVALAYGNLAILDKGWFLLSYGASIALIYSLALGMGTTLWELASKRQPLRRRYLDPSLASGAALLILLRLGMVIRTGHLKLLSAPVFAGLLTALLGALVAGVLCPWLQRRSWVRNPAGLLALPLLALLAVIPYLGRQRTYPFPTPNPAPKSPKAHSPLSARDTNLLLISIDTLRSDHLSGYGYERDTAPTLQRLMEKGIHFQGVTTRSQTAAAMATLLTGTYPPTHGLLDNRESLATANLSLAEILQSRGYVTWAVVSNPVIGTAFGFDQGFDRFLTPALDQDNLSGSLGLNHLALPVLERIKNQRFFLWLHYKDPHRPYLAPPGYRELYLDDDLYKEQAGLQAPNTLAFGDAMATDPFYDSQNLNFAISQYDAEIKFNDDAIKATFDKLTQLELWDNTLVVITADHGESLGDHDNYFEHGKDTYDSNVLIPLIFYHPKLPASRQETDTVSLVDLEPTILDLLGLPQPRQIEGHSFASTILNQEISSTRAYHFTMGAWRYGYHTHSVRSDSYKLIFDTDPRWLPFDTLIEKAARLWLPRHAFNIYRCRVLLREIFDLRIDPGEENNLYRDSTNRQKELTQVLWRWMDYSYHKDNHSLPGRIEPELEKALRALGYAK